MRAISEYDAPRRAAAGSGRGKRSLELNIPFWPCSTGLPTPCCLTRVEVQNGSHRAVRHADRGCTREA